MALIERILSGGHRTADPEEADFFYIPGSARDLKKSFLLEPLLNYVIESWPYWNSTGGGRHIMPAEGGERMDVGWRSARELRVNGLGERGNCGSREVA